MKPGVLTVLAAAVIGGSVSAAAHAVAAPGGAEALPLHEPVARTLRAGEAHRFTLALDAGAFLALELEQDGVDAAVKVSGPGGVVALDQNLVDQRCGREPVFLIAAQAGDHLVEVRAARWAPGRYRLRAALSPSATARDQQRLAARTELAEAKRLDLQQQAQAYRTAIPRYRAALALWREAEEPELALSTLIAIGRVQLLLSALADAGPPLSEALELARDRGQPAWQARALQLLGDVATARSDFPQALLRYQEALALARSMEDRAGVAEFTHKVAVARFSLGEMQLGLDLARESIGLWRALGDGIGEAEALATSGAILLERGEVQEALDVYSGMVPLRRQEGNKRGEAMAHANLAVAYSQLGERVMAVEALERAVALYREIGERRHLALVLTNLAVQHRALGNHAHAAELFDQSLPIAREIGDRRREGGILRHRALLRLTLGELDAAAADAEASLRLLEDGDDWSRAGALRALAGIRRRQGRLPEARAAGLEGLGLHRALGDRGGEAIALFELAHTAREAGDLPGARRWAQEAVERVDLLRRTVRSVSLRASYIESLHEYFELYVDILMRMHEKDPGAGLEAEAFLAVERARGRGLLELLVESRAAVQEGVDPALIEREQKVKDALSLKLDQQVRLASGAPRPEEKEALADEVDTLTAEYEEVRTRMRAQSPKYAALTQPEPRSLQDIQRQVLEDEGTLLLEYALGSPRSYLWALTARGLSAHALPDRDEIEKAARRAYELLSRREPGAAEQREREELMAGLGGTLLGPVAGLASARRVLVVADGALQYLPFAALPDPANGGAPLVAAREVVGAPSASLLALLREEVGTRPPAPKAVAVLADPVFDARDPRLARAAPAEPAPGSGDRDLARAAQHAGLEGGLARLPFTRREAQAILALAPPARRRGALDFEASRVTATDPDLGSYRYLHFATHGFLNGSRPELSGLVLSLVDSQGRPQKGFLAAPDVFDLRLGADLVVLSGCRTALGREVRGEGLVGLARAFMYAGAPRVAASLWKVDDAATAELMKGFYQGLLQRGLRPAAALRRAQLAMRRSGRFAEPYYWAAFQLQGEWN